MFTRRELAAQYGSACTGESSTCPSLMAMQRERMVDGSAVAEVGLLYDSGVQTVQPGRGSVCSCLVLGWAAPLSCRRPRAYSCNPHGTCFAPAHVR